MARRVARSGRPLAAPNRLVLMPPLAVFVDLDGTLVTFDRPYAEITAATLRAHLGAAPAALVETYREAFFEAFDALVPRPYHAGMAAVLDAADTTADPTEMVDTLRAEEHAALTVDPAVPRALKALSADGPLGVLTNGVPGWQRAKLDHVGLTTHVDALVASYDAGAHKPAPAPFRRAEAVLPADNHLMIGDSDADVEGARRAGWQALRHTTARPFWRRQHPTDLPSHA